MPLGIRDGYHCRKAADGACGHGLGLGVKGREATDAAEAPF